MSLPIAFCTNYVPTLSPPFWRKRGRPRTSCDHSGFSSTAVAECSDEAGASKREKGWPYSVSESLSTIRHSFRMHFIRMHGPEIDPTVRVLLVETTNAEAVYEGFGSWPQCKLWIMQISEFAISGNQLAAIHKRLDLKRLATIQEVRASLFDIDSIGLQRTGLETGHDSDIYLAPTARNPHQQ